MKYLLHILFAMTLLAGVTDSHAQRDRKRKEPSESALSGLREREAESAFTNGMRYFMLEDYAKALGYFQHVAEIHPEEPMVHFKVAQIYAKGTGPDDPGRAAASIETAIRLDKKNKYFYLTAANIYRSQNNFAKAAEMLEIVTRDLDPSGMHLYELAGTYRIDGKLDDAIRTYNRAEAIWGVNEDFSLSKLEIYFQMGKAELAIAEGEKLMTAFPDEEALVVGISENLALKGHSKKAIEYLQNFLTKHPESGTSKMLLANLYRDMAREADARKLYREAFADPSVELSSKLVVVQIYTAQIAQNTERKVTDNELQEFTTLLYEELKRRHTDEPDVYIAGGNLFISLQQKEGAEIAFLSAIQHGSTSFEAWQNLLALEAEGGKFDSLVFHSEKGMEIFPNQAMLYYFNGYGNLSTRNYREAASSLERARRLSLSNPSLLHDINSMLGDVYNATREFAKSDQAYEAALRHNPNDAFVLNNYSYHLATRKEHLEKAQHMAEQVTKAFPANATYLDTYAWVLFVRDKFKDARKVMEQALALPGVTSVHYDHYGEILFQLGEVDNAVRQWEKARSMTTDHEALDRKIANRRPN